MEHLQSEEQFQQLTKSDKVIFLFTAGWCPDCRVIEPFLPKIEEKYSSYQFISVDRDQFIDICAEYDIFGIPSFLAFDKGEEIDRFVSKDRKTKEEIESFLTNLFS
ncbi:thioredoxin family protein [Gracilibacillus oryzae]|uniref:Thioredoxin family protein n=1 Tax=Gracilibacillus oryzae TaxID=1672701 RepID=A0A7C8KTC7_9BACI|nr:thioredoxin family protein [Gracilibacillus oryzae]KAB8138329.1 thioredoxin family protein [Gracilibacillus oryzae]